MQTDPQILYSAIKSRDPRFDGRFFMAVLTTGIYCRPVCPARTPKFENLRIYPSAAAAQEAGFRPCLRCRPETAPTAPAWLEPSSLVVRALRLIAEGFMDDAGAEALAARLGISERHLRRLFLHHLGASPSAVAQTRRLHLAKRLIDETALAMTKIAFYVGFSSIRRFNATFKNVYGKSPSQLRRQAQHASRRLDRHALHLTLSYRPPFHWPGLSNFIAQRALPGIEEATREHYRRTVRMGDDAGIIEVHPIKGERQLALTVPTPLARAVGTIVERIQRLFDLKSDSTEVDQYLSRDPLLAPIVARHPGMRVPGAWDMFELAVRAILGQRISVKAAKTLASRLAPAYGDPLPAADSQTLGYLFPTPAQLSKAKLENLGIDAARAQAIRALAAEIHRDGAFLAGYTDLEDAIKRLTSLPGIGPWTAHYIAMRALGEPDAFPAGDLVLRRAAGGGKKILSESELLKRAESWRPWRAYAAIYLWSNVNDMF